MSMPVEECWTFSNQEIFKPEGMGFQITDFDQNQCIQTKYSIQTPL
jgi:hypothetical protein